MISADRPGAASASATLFLPGSQRSANHEGPAEPAALWPTPSQVLLLRAGLIEGPAALEAWRAWTRSHELVEGLVDHGSYRLLPLVWRNLATRLGDDPHARRLKGTYRYWWCSNNDLLHRSAPVLQRLADAGIPTLVLKGAATALLHYRDVGARPMADVDVLVPRGRATEAIDRLAADGWRAPSRWVADEIRFRHSTPIADGRGHEFDLHWCSLREGLGPGVDDGFWRRSVPLELAGVHTRGLAPADAVLHTIVHGLRWNEEPTLRWIPDAVTILRDAGDQLDFELMCEEAERRRVVLRLRRGLDYLRRVLEAPVPDTAWQRLERARVSPLERLEYRYLAARSDPARRERVTDLVPMVALEFARVAAGRSPLHAGRELLPFLRYRLRGRDEAPVRMLRSMRARLRFRRSASRATS